MNRINEKYYQYMDCQLLEEHEMREFILGSEITKDFIDCNYEIINSCLLSENKYTPKEILIYGMNKIGNLCVYCERNLERLRTEK